METPALSARVSAGLIDTALLVAIDLTVLFLTLRITGLQNTFDDVRVLPPIPFAGFLAMLAFGYVAAFTVAGGQTIGKMMHEPARHRRRRPAGGCRRRHAARGRLHAGAGHVRLVLRSRAGHERSSRAARSAGRHARCPRMSGLAVFIATFGYVGFFPIAPGTAGSLAALALFALVRWAGMPAFELVTIVAVFAIGVWAAHRHRARARPQGSRRRS